MVWYHIIYGVWYGPIASADWLWASRFAGT